MIKKEYFNVKEISEKYNTTTRNVRRIIYKIKDNTSENLLGKNRNNMWQIHHLLLPKFRPQRKRKTKYYSLTIRPLDNYSKKDIIVVMKFIYEQLSDNDLIINYTIEENKSMNNHHIHCYVKTKQKRELINKIKEIFCKIDYQQTSIYDLDGWKNYITKDGSSIITLRK